MTTSAKKPELLAPAGKLKNMRFAFAYGADAVYAGQPSYSLRVRENEFNHLDNLAKGIEEAHQKGKKFYIVSNIFPHNNKVRRYIDDMSAVVAMRPDALIMADPGLIMLVRERWPDLPIHLSVQANTMNWAAVTFWRKMGLTRIILSRELAFDEIAEIRQRCPDIELEVFVHGSMCIAYSGRCLLSGYMTHRDANQGACSNACRWQYQLHDAKATECGDVLPVKIQSEKQQAQPALSWQEKVLQEKERPGQYMPIYEDEHGTYIMNAKDLIAIQHIQQLISIGIDSFKIEGRTKTHYYVACATRAYRQAIDDALLTKTFDKRLIDDLEALTQRGYTEGFYQRHRADVGQNYHGNKSNRVKPTFVGNTLHYNPQDNTVTVEVKNRFAVGDTLKLITPNAAVTFQLDAMYADTDNMEPIHVAPGSGYVVRCRIPSLMISNADWRWGLLVRTVEQT